MNHTVHITKDQKKYFNLSLAFKYLLETIMQLVYQNREKLLCTQMLYYLGTTLEM